MARHSQPPVDGGIEIAVQDAMHRQVLVSRLGDQVAEAEAIMQMGQVRRLPVIDSAGIERPEAGRGRFNIERSQPSP